MYIYGKNSINDLKRLVFIAIDSHRTSGTLIFTLSFTVNELLNEFFLSLIPVSFKAFFLLNNHY